MVVGKIPHVPPFVTKRFGETVPNQFPCYDAFKFASVFMEKTGAILKSASVLSCRLTERVI